MISAGTLKDRISIYKNESVQNGSGGSSFSLVKYLDTFANVSELKSDPTMIAMQEDVKQVVKVIIRFRPELDLHNGDVMQWRGFSFILNNFVVDPRRTSIEMLCVFVANDTHRNSEIPIIQNTFDFTFDLTFN